jgi:proteasome accessory factor C
MLFASDSRKSWPLMSNSANLNSFDRFNFALPLIGYLMRNDGMKISDVATHFNVSEVLIRESLSALMSIGTLDNSDFETTYYCFDMDRLDDEGVISLLQSDGIEDAPRLSARQASALATGLSILSTLPEFSSEGEIADLLDIIARGSTENRPSAIHYEAGAIDSDVAVIRSAIFNGHRIECVYRNIRGETSTRQIDPVRLDLRGNIWFLRGYCLIHKELRNFRLDHMGSAVELDIEICEDARNIKDIDEAEYLSSEADVNVTVEVTAEAYSMLGDFSAENIREDKKSNIITANIKIGHLPYLGKVISSYGGAATVLKPESARQAVRDYALTALGRDPEKLPEAE